MGRNAWKRKIFPPWYGSQRAWQYNTTIGRARSTWIARWMSDLTQDLRHAFRGMRRDAGFTAFTILIAGLGIGASSTVFSVVNAMLLRPLPFSDPGRLVFVANM